MPQARSLLVLVKRAQGPFPYPDFNPTAPDPSKLPLIAPFSVETAVTFQTWLSEMKALASPLLDKRRGGTW